MSRLLPLVLSLAACVASAPKPSPMPDPAPPANASLHQDESVPAFDLAQESRSIVAQVSGFRGLAEKRPVDVRVLDQAAFAATLEKLIDEQIDPEEVRRERARWFAFGLAPAEADPEAIARSVLDEQVAGFYDPRSKALYVRRAAPDAADGENPAELRSVLAHEIQHALQDQHFGLERLESLNDDARLAFQTAVEGEAMLVMLAYAAGGSLDRAAMTQLATTLERLPVEALLRLGGRSERLLEAPAIVRAELVTPYVAGLGLAARVYAAGGWEGLDRFLRHPPASSEQVLHPTKYFVGEPPVEIPLPSTPKGHRFVASGRLGELGIRVLLEGCGIGEAKEAAAGWGGDAWLVTETPDGQLALQWRTVWDSRADADEFEAAAVGLKKCWVEQQDGREGWRLAAGASVAGDAERGVALVRGLPVPFADRLAEGLSSSHAP